MAAEVTAAYKACCCTCRWHHADFHHCCTARELRQEKRGCVCGVQKGWICAPPESERMYSGWPEHGICEMQAKKEWR